MGRSKLGGESLLSPPAHLVEAALPAPASLGSVARSLGALARPLLRDRVFGPPGVVLTADRAAARVLGGQLRPRGPKAALSAGARDNAFPATQGHFLEASLEEVVGTFQ